jgi:hypothetical protein
METKRKSIPVSIQKRLDEKYKQCANHPDDNKIKDYDCPMWIIYGGYFDESGYEIDHIDEFSKTRNNDFENLQLLCHSCHAVKTKLFMKNKCKFTTAEINNGACLMDVVEDKNKKRRLE